MVLCVVVVEIFKAKQLYSVYYATLRALSFLFTARVPCFFATAELRAIRISLPPIVLLLASSLRVVSCQTNSRVLPICLDLFPGVHCSDTGPNPHLHTSSLFLYCVTDEHAPQPIRIQPPNLHETTIDTTTVRTTTQPLPYHLPISTKLKLPPRLNGDDSLDRRASRW